MSALAERECLACKGDVPPLQGEALQKLARELDGQWQVVEGRKLEKEYKFNNFREALRFTNKVGELAEAVNHHPDIYLAWGKVKLEIWTHKINGLTESDFVLAAKADRALSEKG
jgi:4a-hydroxytetrahydrobiopterin dehydratase